MMENILIQGKTVPFDRGTLSLNDCKLDPQNPRIQFMIGQKAGHISENELDELIWQKDAVKALAQSIFQTGGVYDAIIVQKESKNFLVREGNCRTVACRHLRVQYPNDARFLTMPAMIFDVDLTAEDLAVLLADMHVAGKIRWDAYEQAKHVSDLFNVYGKTYDWLSNHLRLSKSKIKELLEAHRATTEYLTAHPAPANVKKFAVFHEVMKKKDLRERFTDDPNFKQTFHKWLSDDRINDSKQIRDLPAILANSEATKVMQKSGFAEAQKILMRDDPTLESDAFWAIKNATEYLKAMPASDIHDLKGGNPQKIIMIRNLQRAIEDVATLAGIKV